jgi:hypothetical protein
MCLEELEKVSAVLVSWPVADTKCSCTTETELWATIAGYLILCGACISGLKVIFR